MSAPTLPGVDRMTVLLHRRTLWLGLGLVVLAGFLAGGVRLWKQLAPDRAACMAGADRVEECGTSLLGYPYAESWHRLFADSGGLTLLAVPPLLAALVAGPVIARELEGGLHRLAWTQSVTPTRWLASRLAVFATAAMALSTALVVIYRVTWRPMAADSGTYWYDTGTYESSGPVLVALSLLGVAVGALIGALTRRTITALATGVVATVAVQLVLIYFRPRLWPSSTMSWINELGDDQPSGPIWPVAYGWVNGSGERVPNTLCDNVHKWSEFESCQDRHDIVGQYMDYHPTSHHWPLQFVETGIVLALAAVAVFVTFRVLRARTP
ncbi:ABC transporter permease [Streptomyces sp. NPDC058001]|uniref:ABC transporter permease n=1 Tax=Streptomyces sp. NPDC058001 TaxID=3346300 RepID=UPI0036E20B8B